MTHPILAAVADIRASLKSAADANPTFMPTDDKALALSEVVRAEGQLAELRLRILADAGDLAHETAARDAAGWLAFATRTRFADARADVTLAVALDRDHPVLADAMREGNATLAQAHVIHRAIESLPAAVDADTVALAEAHLVAQAAEFGPKELGRLGRRILDVVAPEIAEAAEAARLADLEAHAADITRLTMRRLGDGTTRISGRVPDAVGTRFATYLEAYANPRVSADGEPTGQGGDPLPRLPYPKRMGQALAQFLESIDPQRLPIHGGDATTVIVTIPLASLQADLGAADLIGAGLVPGDDLTGDRITAGQARRLACTAKILPAVLGGTSLPLDLGRARRFFNADPAQGPADPRHDLPRRGLRRPRHLVRGPPPPRSLVRGRAHRPRRRRAALQPSPPPRPRRPFPSRAPRQRRRPLPPAEIGALGDRIPRRVRDCIGGFFRRGGARQPGAAQRRQCPLNRSLAERSRWAISHRGARCQPKRPTARCCRIPTSEHPPSWLRARIEASIRGSFPGPLDRPSGCEELLWCAVTKKQQGTAERGRQGVSVGARFPGVRHLSRAIAAVTVLAVSLGSEAVGTPASADSQDPVGMVMDVRPGAIGSSLSEFVSLGNTLFFNADDGAHGESLWKTDGTATGTSLLKDLDPYTGGQYNLPPMVTVGSTLFFTDGRGLWKTDGTATGTVLVKDMNPGTCCALISNLVAVGSTLFFSARDATNGQELWKSDGTADGTVLVKDVVPGTSGSEPAYLVPMGGSLFFTTTDLAGNPEQLWKSDGTADGTVLVKDIFPMSSDRVYGLVPAGDTLFFSAYDGSGQELWKSDGTAVGTVMVKDINPTPASFPFPEGSSSPSGFRPAGNVVFFYADDGSTGQRLWQSDGTAAGTVPAEAAAAATRIGQTGSSLFVFASALWRSDGTTARDRSPQTAQWWTAGRRSGQHALLYHFRRQWSGGAVVEIRWDSIWHRSHQNYRLWWEVDGRDREHLLLQG